MSEINPAFSEALRQLGRPTTPEDLRRRGVNKLLSVSMAEISLLIERSVNRTLMERTIGPLDEAGMQEVLHQAQDHFTRQLRDLEDLADSRGLLGSHRREMQAELTRLRGVLTDRRGFQEQSPPPPPLLPAEVHKRLLRQVHLCLAPLLPGGRLEGSAKGVAQDLVALAVAHANEALEAQRRTFELETQRQERRLVKLVESLQRTEEVLARLAKTKDLEEGIESLYRTVQGLSAGDTAAALKREMLARIFEANLELRAGVQSASANRG